ncbi:MAG: hypothetical protein ABIT71_12710 [Vicinamibacteraceae bacterium]
MRLRRILPTFGKAAVPWLLEGLLIVFSVVLGFWVSQLQGARADRELGVRVLASVHEEVEHNVALLQPYIRMHRTWTEALAKAPSESGPQAAFDVFIAVRPPLPAGAATPFPSLRRSAWDAALSGGAIRFLDHDVAAALSDIYRRQQIVDDNIARLATGALGATATFDPASRTPSVRLLWLTVADITSAEEVLAAGYGRHLPGVRAAVERGR